LCGFLKTQGRGDEPRGVKLPQLQKSEKTFDNKLSDELKTFMNAEPISMEVINKNVEPTKAEMVKEMGHLRGYYSSRIFIYEESKPELLNLFTSRFEDTLKTIQNDEIVVSTVYNEPYLDLIEKDFLFSNNRREQGFLGQIGDINLTILKNKTTEEDVLNCSLRTLNGGIEISRLLVQDNQRGKGLGTSIINAAKTVTEKMSLRLLLFPCPPSTEVDRQGWNPLQAEIAQEKLINWYANLGFVKCLPEFIPVVRVSGNKKMNIGIFDFCFHGELDMEYPSGCGEHI
jgi:predicted GNAT family N-acyltransferase